MTSVMVLSSCCEEQLSHPLSHGGGSPNGCERPGSAESVSGRARALPFGPPKRGQNAKSRKPVRDVAAFGRAASDSHIRLPTIGQRPQCSTLDVLIRRLLAPLKMNEGRGLPLDVRWRFKPIDHV